MKLDACRHGQGLWSAAGNQFNCKIVSCQFGCQQERTLQVPDTQQVLDIDHDAI
jgi:hypothetical protein